MLHALPYTFSVGSRKWIIAYPRIPPAPARFQTVPSGPVVFPVDTRIGHPFFVGINWRRVSQAQTTTPEYCKAHNELAPNSCPVFVRPPSLKHNILAEKTRKIAKRTHLQKTAKFAVFHSNN